MKKLLALILALAVFTALFTGCVRTDGGETAAVPETDTPAPETEAHPVVDMRVALLTDYGPIEDGSMNQAVLDGVMRACEAYGVTYSCYESAADSIDHRVEAMEAAVSEGNNVLVLTGYLYGEALLSVQDQYPDVYFLAVDVCADDLTHDYVTYYEPSPNALCITFEEDQAGYLAGYAAVADGYTRLGFHGNVAVPSMIRYGYGFLQGANAAAEELGIADQVSVQYAYDNCFCDAVPNRLNGMYADGVEVVFAGVGICSLAVTAANNYDGKVIGIDVDQHSVDSCVITSAMKRMDVAVEDILTDLFRGEWEGGQVRNLSLQDGDYIGLPTDPDAWRFNTFTMEQYEKVLNELKNGARSSSSDIDNEPKVSIRVEYLP